MDAFIFYLFAVVAFCFGACIGSFLNVVIWRVPRGESIVSPPSHCPKCNAPIKWYQNIPILSWLALGGKCANCKAPISPRYVLIEILGAVLFLASFLAFPLPFLPLVLTWIALMIVGSMIDYDHQLLPDFVTIGGMVLGGVASVVYSVLYATPAFFYHSLVGMVLGFGLFWLIRLLGTKAFKREAMGLGDVFLMGAVGAICGWQGVLFVLIFSSLFGSVVGLSLVALAKSKFGRFVEIPYGPYICLATLLYMFFGDEIISVYLQLLHLGTT